MQTTGLWSETGLDHQQLDLTLALTVLASVSVVVWTGGVVAFQLKKADIKTSLGMDLLGVCFIGCTITIVAHWTQMFGHHLLRFATTLFALRYLYVYLRALLVSICNANRTSIQYSRNGLQYLIPIYIVVIVFPLQTVVAWIGVATLYFGLWNILNTLQKLDPVPVDTGDT